MRFIASLILILVLVPYGVFAFTQSADLESSSSQYATANDSASLDVTGDFTLETWVKFESIPSTASTFINKNLTTGNQRSYWFAYDGTGGNYSGSNRLVCYADEDGQGGATSNYTRAYASWTPSTGVWYHVACTYTAGAPGGTMAIYVDGVSQSVTYDLQLAASVKSGTANVYIGADQNNGTPQTYMDGKMFIARIWSSARTSSEISNNWCTQLNSGQAEWTLDNTLNDTSGNSNTLTNVNSFVFSADIPSACNTPVATEETPHDQIINNGNIIINNGNQVIR